jgi:hypothetical protein
MTAGYTPQAPPALTEGEGTAQTAKAPMAFAKMGFEIETFEQAWRFAQSLCAAGMVPKAYGNHPGAVLLIMQACAQLQIPIHVGLSNLTFVNGRFGIMGDLAHALVLRSGLLKKGTDIRVVYTGERDKPDWTCTVSVHRADQAEPKSSSFSMADATRAGLAGKSGPWKEYRERMLYYRALGFLVRDVFPDVLMGFYTKEELDDFPEERDVTPTPAHTGQGPGADPLLELGVGAAPVDFAAEAAAAGAARDMEVVETRKPTAREQKTGLRVAEPEPACTHQHADGSPSIELRANPEGDEQPALEWCTQCEAIL